MKTRNEQIAAQEGGWGWVVVVGSHVIQILTSGAANCMGLFLVEWLKEFDASATELSWIIGIVPMCNGLLSKLYFKLVYKWFCAIRFQRAIEGQAWESVYH